MLVFYNIGVWLIIISTVVNDSGVYLPVRKYSYHKADLDQS